MTTKQPFISAIVLNYVNWSETVLCIEDLLGQDYSQLDIVVVDNCSPNDSQTQLAQRYHDHPRVTVVQAEKNGGYSAGNNFGAQWRLGTGPVDYFVIANNDTRLPQKSTISLLVEFAEATMDLGVVGPKVVTGSGFLQGPFRRPSLWRKALRYVFPMFPLLYRILRRRFGRRTGPVPCFGVVGAFFLVRASAFAKVGMFDTFSFLGAEEYMLADRLAGVGLRAYYFPGVTVIHNHSKSAIVRTGGEERYFWMGVESQTHYFKEYQHRSTFEVSVFRTCAKVYTWMFLPWRHRLRAFLCGSGDVSAPKPYQR